MTRTDRKKVAKAARELAMECVAGTAPDMGVSMTFSGQTPCCAIGHVVAMAGFTARDYANMTGIPSHAWWIVTQANDTAPTVSERHAAVAFPLLWLADELESAR